MTVYNSFRNRMNRRGTTARDRAMNVATRSFEAWFENTLNRELVKIDGIENYVVFQDQNQNNNKDLSDDKYVILKNGTEIHVGSIVEWRGELWMTFSQENKTIPTHQQFKVKPTNQVIKWMMPNGNVSNNGNGYPAFIQNQTLYTLGVSTSGDNAWIVNAKMMMYLPDSEEARDIEIGQRIAIGKQIYRIFFKDYVSRNGLVNYLLEQDMANASLDNLDLGIADYYSNGVVPNDTTNSTSTSEVVISGSDKAKIGSQVTYMANEDITEWTIADVDGVSTIISQTTTEVTLQIVSNFQSVGSTITVIGKTADGTIGSKAVYIVSPY